MTDEDVIKIIDGELYKAYKRGDDVGLCADNGSIFGSVYNWCCIKHGCRISSSGYDFIISKRFSLFLIRIRSEKIDSLLANPL